MVKLLQDPDDMGGKTIRQIRFPELTLENLAFPTNVVAAMGLKHGFDERTHSNGNYYLYAIRDFQRLALTQEFEVAIEGFKLTLKEEELNDEDIKVLKRMFDFTKKEVNGIIVGAVADLLYDESKGTRLDAAKLLTVLINNKDTPDANEMKKLLAKIFK